jgi:hypothetical protein
VCELALGVVISNVLTDRTFHVATMEPSIIHSARVEQLSQEQSTIEHSTIRCSVRLHAAFEEFLKALEYADELQTTPWDFALEMSCLRRLKLTNNDLRWLIGKGFISHAIETTLADDSGRKFKPTSKQAFSKHSCFVLTPKGAAMGRAVWRRDASIEEVGESLLTFDTASAPPAFQNNGVAPTWDRERQELRVGALVVKRFRVPALSQETVLAAFEEEAWPPRIDDPLPPRSDQSPKRRLQETIKSLNRNQKHPLIRFLGDGSAQGILWQYCDEVGSSRGGSTTPFATHARV